MRAREEIGRRVATSVSIHRASRGHSGDGGDWPAGSDERKASTGQAGGIRAREEIGRRVATSVKHPPGKPGAFEREERSAQSAPFSLPASRPVWSSLWGTQRRPLRCRRLPSCDITTAAETVSVNVSPSEKPIVSGGARERKPPKCTVLHSSAQLLPARRMAPVPIARITQAAPPGCSGKRRRAGVQERARRGVGRYGGAMGSDRD